MTKNIISKASSPKNSKTFQKKKPRKGIFLFAERVTGVEPVSLPWQGNIISRYTIPASYAVHGIFNFQISIFNFVCRRAELNPAQISLRLIMRDRLPCENFQLAPALNFTFMCQIPELNWARKDFQSFALPLSYLGGNHKNSFFNLTRF